MPTIDEREAIIRAGHEAQMALDNPALNGAIDHLIGASIEAIISMRTFDPEKIRPHWHNIKALQLMQERLQHVLAAKNVEMEHARLERENEQQKQTFKDWPQV